MSEQGKTTALGGGSPGVLEQHGAPANWDVGRRLTGANVTAPVKIENGRLALEQIAHVGMPAKLDLTGYLGNEFALGTLVNLLIDRCTELVKALIYAEHMRR